MGWYQKDRCQFVNVNVLVNQWYIMIHITILITKSGFDELLLKWSNLVLINCFDQLLVFSPVKYTKANKWKVLTSKVESPIIRSKLSISVAGYTINWDKSNFVVSPK